MYFCWFRIHKNRRPLRRLRVRSFTLGLWIPEPKKKTVETNKRRNETSGGSHPWLFWSPIGGKVTNNLSKTSRFHHLNHPKKVTTDAELPGHGIWLFPQESWGFSISFQGCNVFCFLLCRCFVCFKNAENPLFLVEGYYLLTPAWKGTWWRKSCKKNQDPWEDPCEVCIFTCINGWFNPWDRNIIYLNEWLNGWVFIGNLIGINIQSFHASIMGSDFQLSRF